MENILQFIVLNVSYNIILQCVGNQQDAQFLINNFIPQFFLSVHFSNESSRSSTGALFIILYQLRDTTYKPVLLMMNDWFF